MFSAIRRHLRTGLSDHIIATYRTLRHAWLFPFEAELPYVRRFLSKKVVAIDVGANVGLYTRQMAKHAGWVIAFEPHPDCARHLQATAPRNATVVAAGLSDHSGPGILVTPLTADGTEQHGIGHIGEGEGRHYTVSLTTLDLALNSTAQPQLPIGFIKIDVEGHEQAVLEGARKTLALHRPVLMIELEYRHNPRTDDTFAFLGSLGYRPQVLRDGALQTITPQMLLTAQLDPDRYINNVFFLQ